MMCRIMHFVSHSIFSFRLPSPDNEMESLLARVGRDSRGPQARRSAIAGTVAPQDYSSIDDVLQMMDFSGILSSIPGAFQDRSE